MTGEKANKIYIAIGLGSEIQLDNEEEREFYNSLKKEIEETRAKSDKSIQWEVPFCE